MTHTNSPIIHLRDAREDDAAAIQAIYAPYVLNGLATFEEIVPDATEMKRRMVEIFKLGFPYLVAEINGRVIGYAYVGPYRTRSAYRYTVENSIYISPDATRQGAGQALLRELLVRCEALGLRQMIAMIGDSNNTPSIALHTKMGFKTVGIAHATGFKLGRWIDTVILQLALGDGETTPPD